MAEGRNLFTIKSDDKGEIKTSEEVVTIIAGMAATEVEGVSSLAGNITYDLVSKMGLKHLSKAVAVETAEDQVTVDVILNIAYGYNIPDVSSRVQDRIKSTIENMTGLKTGSVNVRIASVETEENR